MIPHYVCSPLRDGTFFGAAYGRMSAASRRAVSSLFPAYLAGPADYAGQRVAAVTLDDVVQGRFEPQVVVVASRALDRIAALGSLLQERGRVLVVCPLFETPQGPEQTSPLFGPRSYQHRNFRCDFLNAECGVHMAQQGNCVTVMLHSFQYYFDANQIANQNACGRPLRENLEARMSVDNGAEIALQRAWILRDFMGQFLPRLSIPPAAVLCTEGFATLAGLALQQFYKNFFVTTSIRSSIPVLVQKPKFILWEAINYRNIFENINSLKGHKIFDGEYTNRLLDLLQI